MTDKPIIFADCETTGLPNFKEPADAPGQPRICQLAAALYDQDGNELEHFEHIIKPDGWSIPDETAKIHGLTTHICQEQGILAFDALQAFLAMHDKAGEFAAYGTGFDLKMIRGELRRAGLPDRYGAIPAFDVMQAATQACRVAPTNAMMATGRKTNKTAKLIEAAEILLGVKHEGAHTALADVRMTARLYFHLRGKTTIQAKQHVPRPRDDAPAAPKPTPTPSAPVGGSDLF